MDDGNGSKYAGQRCKTDAFLPLQGFFNLIVYMFPRILRYFEEGVPLTQSFKRSSFISSLQSSASRVSAVFKKNRSQTPGKQSSCAYDEGDVENVESTAALEVEVDHSDKENREGGGLNGDNTNGEVESGEEDGEGDGEKDVIDELEHIVDT